MLRYQRRTGFWAGLLVGIALTGVLYLGSRLKLTAFVPLDIANAIIKFTPGDIATATIETLGVWGMRSLVIASVVGFILGYASLGMLLATWLQRRPGRATALLFGTISAGFPFGLTLLLERSIPANRAIATLDTGSVLLLAFVYGLSGLLLGWLTAGLISRTAPVGEVSGTSRRRFLLGSAGAALTLAAGSGIAAALIPRRGIEQAGVALPTAAPIPPTVAPIPTAAATAAVGAPTPTAGPPTATPLPSFVPALGTRPEITSQESLYLISSSTRDPEIDVDSWRLRIFGAVDRPYELTYAELLALPRQDQTSTLECISNEVGNLLIGNCNWNGVRLRDLLERAGVQADVVDIRFNAAEGYSESLPLARALDPNTLVAYGIDGQSLTVPHGFPARLRIAGKYGVKNVKWLTEIEAVREDYQGYWQQRGWIDDATIFTTSVYDTGNPRLGGSTLQRQNGAVSLGGIAFAGDRGIRLVEIQIDGADWQEVQLKEALSDSAWRLWRYEWRGAAPGKHTLAVRAVDGSGQAQVAAIADTHPNGATGYHTLEVEVR